MNQYFIAGKEKKESSCLIALSAFFLQRVLEGGKQVDAAKEAQLGFISSVTVELANPFLTYQIDHTHKN